ncbi:MAG: hypothetical protein JWR84_1918 [Caulobacter sp.]|nr:hypothetical protein [Caulobacter sp.]
MRKLFLIFCSSMVLTTALAVAGLSSAHDNSLYTTVSRSV